MILTIYMCTGSYPIPVLIVFVWMVMNIQIYISMTKIHFNFLLNLIRIMNQNYMWMRSFVESYMISTFSHCFYSNHEHISVDELMCCPNLYLNLIWSPSYYFTSVWIMNHISKHVFTGLYAIPAPLWVCICLVSLLLQCWYTSIYQCLCLYAFWLLLHGISVFYHDLSLAWLQFTGVRF